ncbi:MAG: cytochrome c oxidase subunit 3 family protein [Leptospirales bacterium]|nr:cytochrome c oxidase subunit 3 family protein [Leptospirales bacterium]
MSASTHALYRDKHPVHEELGGYEGAKLGMWLFLATELLLFGVLFALFFIFHGKFLEPFKAAHHTLDKVMGGLNTVVLIVSSLSVALGLDAIQRGRRKLSMICMGITIALAGTFLVVKYFEYSEKFHHHIFPGNATMLKDDAVHEIVSVDDYIARRNMGPEEAADFKKGVNLFFTFYFMMTGVHGLHVIIGMTVLFIIMLKMGGGRYSHWYYTPVENGALYWHLVDLIWIYLFPLFYLIS